MSARPRRTRAVYIPVVAAVSAMTLVAACSSSSGPKQAAGSNIGTTVAQVCANGAKEGSVDIARGSDADTFAKAVASFESKYPGIKVHFTSIKPQDNVQRILAEVQSGHSLDVDGTDFDIASAQPLFQAKLVAKVDWAQLGVDKSLVVDYSGTGLARTDSVFGGLTYDTTRTQPSDLPSTWEQLVNSKWAGKFVVDTRGKLLSPLALVWGESKALSWYRNLMSVAKPVGIEGATASLQKVTSGEAVFSTSAHDSEVAQSKSEGAKVAIKYLDIVPAQTDYAYILDRAPHPNAARCFYAWRLSQDGQAQFDKYEFKTDAAQPAGLPAGSQIAADRTAQQGLLDAKVASEFAKLTTQ
ncbi:MAG TPA: extracellular solute-binding protein [Jatrophihabitans sp.]|nr:extracellular solute-binding protein [Jatrophihabitans sp.]